MTTILSVGRTLAERTWSGNEVKVYYDKRMIDYAVAVKCNFVNVDYRQW